MYAIDVGYGQLAWKLRADERVVVMERTNARHLGGLPGPVSLVVADLSFISVTRMLPAIRKIRPPNPSRYCSSSPSSRRAPEALEGTNQERIDPGRRDRDVIAACETAKFAVLGATPSPPQGAGLGISKK